MLLGLVPEDVVRRRKDEVYKVMGELADIVGEEDGSSWSFSRKECVEWTCRYFWALGLEHPNLSLKLKRLGDTWNSSYCS